MKFYVKYNIMIFNKQNKGTEELRELTGNYYKNNDFSKVSAQIELVTEEVTWVSAARSPTKPCWRPMA